MPHVYEYAREWIGVPFHHQGRTFAGIDCIGLIVVPGQKAGKRIEDRTNYSPFPTTSDLLRALEEQFDPVSVEAHDVDDVLAFNIRKRTQHVAIRSDYGIIHALAGQQQRGRVRPGKVVETCLDERWYSRVHSAWRYRT